MNVRSTIEPAVLTAATAMLQHYVPELSPKTLTEALRCYRGDNIKKTDGVKPLTRHDCAELLGVSVSSINRYIKQGRIRAKKISDRLIRIERQSVMDLLNCDKVEA